jgi:hypothetical protein
MRMRVAWFKDLGERDVIKDPANPLDRSGKVVRGHGKDVHDGPYAEAKDLVNGYPQPRARRRCRALSDATSLVAPAYKYLNDACQSRMRAWRLERWSSPSQSGRGNAHPSTYSRRLSTRAQIRLKTPAPGEERELG